MGLGSVINLKDLLQCLFRVLVVCGGRDQRGGRRVEHRRLAGPTSEVGRSNVGGGQVQLWAPKLAFFVTCGPSRHGNLMDGLTRTAILFKFRHLGHLLPESDRATWRNSRVTKAVSTLSYVHRGKVGCSQTGHPSRLGQSMGAGPENWVSLHPQEQTITDKM